MSQTQKNFLFISNNCQHSKRLLLQLQKSNTLLSSLQIVNIDDARIQLPQFVQCVPTLYIPSKKHVLTDTDLFQWFQTEIQNENRNSGKVNIADITGDAGILPFQLGEMGNGLAGATYSFIEDDKNDLMNQNYSFLQDRDINKVPDYTKHNAPSNSGGNNSNNSNNNSSNNSNNSNKGTEQRKTGGTTDSAYEILMKSRSSDINQRTIPQMPNFSDPV